MNTPTNGATSSTTASSGGNMERVLRLMAEKSASDVYLSAATPILIKINGQILQLSDQPLSAAQPRQLLAELLTPSQLEDLEEPDRAGADDDGVGLDGIRPDRYGRHAQQFSGSARAACPSCPSSRRHPQPGPCAW